MIHLLDALQDSENTVGKSMLSLFNSMQGVLSETIMRLEKNFESVFDQISDVPFPHKNPILTRLQTDYTNKNASGKFSLPEDKVSSYYRNGFIDEKFKFCNVSPRSLKQITQEYIEYKNNCIQGNYDSAYSNLPDYVGHLYITGVVELLYNNYDEIIQRAMSIMKSPEEELFLSVGIFHVDKNKKGINVHQDYSYAIKEHLNPLTTRMLTIHTAISMSEESNFYLFPNTHHEILYTLQTLQYLLSNNIHIEPKLAFASAVLADYGLKLNQYPYNNGYEIFSTSHYGR